MMLFGAGMEVLADDVITEGYYYLQNKQNDNNGYYLCPAIGFNYKDDEATPYLTTYQTHMDNNSVWHIIKVTEGTDVYYRLLHVATGKYLTVNEAVSNTGKTPTARMRLHLEASDSPGENTLFFAKQNASNDRIAFRPKSPEYYDATSKYCWFDISDGNQDSYNSGSYIGTLGFWNLENQAIGNIAIWQLEEVMPVISHDKSAGTFSITCPITGDDVSIYYTIDGTTPTAASTPYTLGATISDADVTMLKAVAIKDGVSSAVAEVYTPNYPVMLRNGGNNTTSYYLCPPMPTETKDLYATTSNVPTQYLAWQLQYEGMEDGRAIYTLKNQATGKYLYCRVNVNQGNAYEMKDELDASGTEANRYRFYFTPAPNGTYNLISTNFGYQSPNNNICMYKNGNDGTGYLQTYQDNATNGYARWTIVAADPKTYSEIDFASTAETKRYFKIQNVNSNDYYLNSTTAGGNLVKALPSANSVYDVWYMEKATDDDPWATYYYIRNATTGDYLYFKGNAGSDNTFFTSGSIPDGTERDYKFIIVRTAGTSASDNNSYHIIPKSLRNNGKQDNLALFRSNTTNLKAGTSRGQNSARWNFVAVDAEDVPSPSTTAVVDVTVGSDKHIYYLQSVANTNFYLIPGPASGDDYNVNTLSLPRPSMQWYFKDAGTDGGVQYYYIVNNHVSNTSDEADGYLYNSGNTAMVKATFDESDKDNYCFAVVPHYNGSTPDGSYNIVAKAKIQADVAPTARALYKNDNNKGDNVTTSSSIDNTLSRWNLVTAKPVDENPFTLSTDADVHYYTIKNVGQTGYITPAVAGVSTTATVSTDEPTDAEVWYFKEAGSDEWLTYYYIINANTGNYLYFNGTNTNNALYIATAPVSDKTAENEDRYQFAFATTVTSGQYQIVPKANRYASNNSNYSLCKESNSTQLKTNWGRNDNRWKWTFEESALGVVAPIITYNNDNTVTLSCTTPGATIYYTTDGTDPTPSSTVYGGTFAVPDGVTTVKAIAVKDGSTSSIASITFPLLVSDITKHSYLIQNLDCTAFYMIPGAVSSGNTTVNTYSLGRPSMAWNIYGAGTYNGIVYYYIKNNETGDYLFCNSAGNVYMKSSEDFDASSDDYKFCIVSDANDGVRIVPKARQTHWLNKADNNKNDAVGTSNSTTATTCRWNFIAFSGQMPAETPPFTVTTSTKGAYYKIGNANAPTYYIIPPTGTTGNAQYVNTSATENDKMIWYFREAASDDWLTYYYIVNAVTGQYLYFNSSTTATANNTAFVTRNITNSSPDTEDRFQFAVARTTQSETDGYYYIVPKPIRNLENANYALVYRDGTNPLKTNANREYAQRKWTFTTVTYKCATPTFNYTPSTRQLTISSSTPEAIIYYTTDGSEPTVTDGTVYTGTITLPEDLTAVKAIAARSSGGSDQSEIAVFTFNEISSTSQITSMSSYYVLASDFTADGSVGTEDNPFTGTIDGGFNAFSLNSPLIAYAKDATIKNVIVSLATINGGENVGAIANIAKGNTRIYNCGILDGTVSGTGNVGGLVGLLDDDSRVINCYSYADITGGTTVGGIVGYNNYATTQTDLRTMVMNCMMYGNISGSSNIYPVYGGEKITNRGENAGVNNYNFYLDEADFTIDDLDHYNCSWPAEAVNLTRFDYFRSALNANRELCAWWITGNADDKDIVAKWVYVPEDAEYPILKPWGRYPSIINRDIDGKSLFSRTDANDYEGKQLGTLPVTVQDGNGTTKTLPDVLITDMDTQHYDYGYYKIQLPYYNDVFGNSNSNNHVTRYGGNYTDQVVVGWEIVSVNEKEGITRNSFSTNEESGYNFADRNCTEKDFYATSGRVFAQGGYYYVPEGVTGVTIKAHWAKAYYCANTDYARDRVDFNPSDTKSYAFTPGGFLANTFHGQPVYAGLVEAQKAISSGGVYENAIVLVGNVQHRNGYANNYSSGLCVNSYNSGYTIMSVDLDFDCEPDYALPLQMGQGTSKPRVSPIRFDFVQAPDLGMVLKRDQDRNRLAVSCIHLLGHFEITETSALHFNELYFGNNNNMKLLAPLIFNGGQTIEFVSADGDGATDTQIKTQYIIAGGNAHMRSLYQGNHNKRAFKIKHAPMSVMGGEFDECYLSGNLKSLATTEVYQDSPHLYTNGGRFGIIAGAGQEAVNGSVYFQIDHSIIDEFYGGSTSSNGITGDIHVQIDHSLVTKYCGGPMVGDMPTGKTITTRATGTTFTEFYGAGNGGTSFTLYSSSDLGADNNRGDNPSDWGLKYTPMQWDNSKKMYQAKYHFEIWQVPSGTSAACASRWYVYGAQFAATKTGSVTTTLTDCTLKGDFYGGGNLGAVEGNVMSTLTDCTVNGSVYGAGYSATVPSFDCYLLPIKHYPHQDPNTSICYDYEVGATKRYTWTHDGKNGDTWDDRDGDGINYVHTDHSLTGLGSVTGTVSVTIDGETKVAGSVYGGGDEGELSGDATVTLQGNAEVMVDVFGGGNKADVSGDTTVNIK